MLTICLTFLRNQKTSLGLFFGKSLSRNCHFTKRAWMAPQTLHKTKLNSSSIINNSIYTLVILSRIYKTFSNSRFLSSLKIYEGRWEAISIQWVGRSGESHEVCRKEIFISIFTSMLNNISFKETHLNNTILWIILNYLCNWSSSHSQSLWYWKCLFIAGL